MEYMRSKRRERKRETEVNRSRMEQARGLRRRLDGSLSINGKEMEMQISSEGRIPTLAFTSDETGLDDGLRR